TVPIRGYTIYISTFNRAYNIGELPMSVWIPFLWGLIQAFLLLIEYKVPGNEVLLLKMGYMLKTQHLSIIQKCNGTSNENSAEDVEHSSGYENINGISIKSEDGHSITIKRNWQ
ncbi:40807_t:CDS:2, partial [Gigaspora margarita]